MPVHRRPGPLVCERPQELGVVLIRRPPADTESGAYDSILWDSTVASISSILR